MSGDPSHLSLLLPDPPSPETPPVCAPVPPDPGDACLGRKGADSFAGYVSGDCCLQSLQSGRGGGPGAFSRGHVTPGGLIGGIRFLAALVVVMFLAASVLAPAARAAPDHALERARTHFFEGEKHYNLGEFADALREFKDSYRLKNDPVLLYNIGQCQLKLGDDRAALHSFRTYLRLAVDPGNRKMAEEKIAQIEGRLGAAGPGSNPAPSAGPDQRRPAPMFIEGRASMTSTGSIAPAPPALANSFVESNQQAAADRDARPTIHHRWWVWAIAAGVVAGAVTAVVMANQGRAGRDCLGINPCGALR